MNGHHIQYRFHEWLQHLACENPRKFVVWRFFWGQPQLLKAMWLFPLE